MRPSSFLKSPIQFLKGVGPGKSRLFQKLGLVTVGDLLTHFPREHDDRTLVIPLNQVFPGRTGTVRGRVEEFDVLPVGRNLALGRALVSDGAGRVRGVWFRRSSPRYDVFTGLRRQLAKGTSVLLHGPLEAARGEIQMRVQDHEILSETGNVSVHAGRLVPVYNLTEGIDGRWLRELVWNCLERGVAEAEETLPAELMDKYGLRSYAWSLRQIHFPDSPEYLASARRRLAFEEFFFLELALARLREKNKEGPPSPPCVIRKNLLTPFRQSLGYEFTAAQKRVINEIFDDMSGDKPMNRLLQGDVGSGKTVVALSAILLAAENGFQSALMVPTEILAEQHYVSLRKMTSSLSVTPVLLTGSAPTAERRRLVEGIKSGAFPIVVGTHALIQEDVQFKNLALAVVDEQHRFGVRQRGLLRAKSSSPHVLVMTATPIPRTLALTLYGDLSTSVINALPPGRRGISTHWTLESNAMEAVRRAADEGRQAFIVFPLIEESDKLDLRAAVKEWERLKTRVFPTHNVGLIHGRLRPSEKEDVMARFLNGETQILVATPVIEVGIDVPNASVMVIMHAERFGLAQLHQLRGRVGRGAHASHCYLVSDSRSHDVAHRLRLMCRTQDGFRLSEEDLKIRGPGEFLGEAQHGIPNLKAGDLIRDVDLIEEARRAAFQWVESDPGLERPENKMIGNELQSRFGGKFFLGGTA